MTWTNTRESESAGCLNPGLSHFHTNRLRGAEESEMRRMLVILKHSSALPAQLFDEQRIRCHSWLPVWSSWRGEKVKVLCGKQHRCTETPSNTARSGLRVFGHCPDLSSHKKLGDSCCRRAPHQGGHSIFAKEQIVSLGWVCCEFSIWAQTCICEEKPLAGPVVIGQGEMVLH